MVGGKCEQSSSTTSVRECDAARCNGVSPSVLYDGPKVVIECQLISSVVVRPLASCPSEIKYSFTLSAQPRKIRLDK